MSRLGVAEDIAELAIGHVRADLIARYNKDEAWEGRSDAFERVSSHVAALIDTRGRRRSIKEIGGGYEIRRDGYDPVSRRDSADL